MNKLYVIVAIITVSGCCLINRAENTSQQCLFDKTTCQNNLQIFQAGINKFKATGGLYIIQDMDTTDIIEVTTVNYQDKPYHPYFKHLSVKEETTPSKLLAQYISEVKKDKALATKLHENVVSGTAKKANIDTIKVYGTTATTENNNSKEVTTTFLGHFEQKHNKSYTMVIVLDNPQPIKSTYGFRSAGWNVVPIARDIINSVSRSIKE